MKRNIPDCCYVLITPARNEERYIEKTILSMVAQTIQPGKWMIVSDGSTDGTDRIVESYLAEYPWINLMRMPEHRDRSFAAKVTAFSAGYDEVKDVSHNIVGNLDADITFDADYFEFLMEKFRENPGLGVAGTPFVENGYSSLEDSFEGVRHVAGGVQLFRRECFEQIGEYVPNRAGGIDWIAVTMARMLGWQTRSYPERHFVHHRSLGTAGTNSIGMSFQYGRKDYYLGGHPLWELFRVIYRMGKKPYIFGGVALLSGYLWAALVREKRPVSRKLMLFHRREQMEKLRWILSAALRFRKIDKYDLN